VAVRGTTVVIGRDPAAGVCIPLDRVSRQHARLVKRGGSYFVEDMKSPAGVFVNGRLVVSAKLLNFDVITLGKAVDLVFTLHEETARSGGTGIVGVRLVPTSQGGLAIDIPRGETILGRSRSSAVVLDHSVVSRRHASLQRTAYQLVVRDLDSANGTFVNGQRATMSPLQNGDELSFGNVDALSFRIAIDMGEVVSGTIETSAPVANRSSGSLSAKFSMNSGLFEIPADRPASSPAPAAPAPAAPPPTSPPAPAASAPLITMVGLSAPEAELVVTEPGRHVVGRSRTAGLRVNHPTVSRRHALLTLSSDRMTLLIADDGGEGGTMLNGRLLETALPLSDGDVVTIGEVRLRVKISR
jgi:pSer/pThr/pTyr-binding forkhead associated (FHA) protein